MSNKWNFAAPVVQGRVPRQAHANIPDGLWEREMGRDAFFGPCTDFYHRHAPTGWSAITGEGLSPHLVDTSRLPSGIGSPWQAVDLLCNASVRIRHWRATASMDHLVRNADGDELLFIHDGTCDLLCDFGHLSLVKGDYVLLPRGTMWRIETIAPVEILMIESTDAAYRLPEDSALGRHLPFDAGLFDIPTIDDAFRAQATETPTEVRVRHGGRVSSLLYPFNPLDAEGWKGDLYPIRLNVANIRPISSHRAHVDPSSHTTFLSDRFMVCTVVPHPAPRDPSAAAWPAFHDNVEYDEAMFVHAGHPSAWSDGFKPGLLSLDPRGLTHGPSARMQAKPADGVERMVHDFTAVVVYARDPMTVGREAPTVGSSRPSVR